MPVRKVPGGYKWGNTGKVYKTKAAAEKQGRAIYAARGYSKGGLGKWFGEEWTDVKTGKECGRSSASDSSRPYPACRPKAVASKISKKEASKKTGSAKVKWSTTASGRKRT
jgi:hypothetical protein